MAIKAMCDINNTTVLSDGTLAVQLWVKAGDEWELGAGVDVNDLDPALGAATVNGAIKAAVKAYCETNWSISFTPVVDTVLLLRGVSLL